MSLARIAQVCAIVIDITAIATAPAIAAGDGGPPEDATAGASAPAGATSALTDGEGFQIDLQLPGVKTCFALPEERTEAVSCEGVDLEPIRDRLSSLADRDEVVAVAILSREDSQSMAIVTKGREELPELSRKEFDKVADGLLQAMAQGFPPEQLQQLRVERTAQLLHVGNLELLHLRLVLHPFKEDGGLDLLIDRYVVLTEGETRIVQFTTMAKDMVNMRPVIDRIVDGVKGRPTQKRMAIDATRGAYPFGRFGAVGALGLIGIAGGAAGYAFARRRNSSGH